MATLLLVDTNDLFEQGVRDALQREPLTKDVEVVRLSPKTTLPPDQMTSEVVGRATELFQSTPIAAVFVDLVVYESEYDPADKEGIAIALGLKRTFPALPVYVVTGRTNSGDGFSYSALEKELDGTFFKSFLTSKSFSAERLQRLLAPAKSTAATAAVRQSTQHTQGSTHVNRRAEAFGAKSTPAAVMAQIDRVGSNDFWSLLDLLLPKDAEGLLSAVSQGRSGASTFVVTAKLRRESLPTKWIVKVDAKKEGLEHELQNYSLVRERLKPEQYAHPLQTTVANQGSLFGIVSELKDSSVTVTDFMEKGSTATEAAAVGTQIAKMLSALYGESRPTPKRPWKEYFEPSPSSRWESLAALESLAPALTTLGYGKERKDATKLLDGEGFVAKSLPEWEVLRFDLRLTHGDLNSGNVLIRTDGTPSIIDLEKLDTSAASLDIAKLCRDLLLRTVDRGSFQDIAWKRLEAWRRIHLAIRAKDGRAAHPTVAFARALRSGLEESAQIRPSQLESDVASLSYYCRSFANETLTLPKRVLAVIVAADLLKQIENALRKHRRK